MVTLLCQRAHLYNFTTPLGLTTLLAILFSVHETHFSDLYLPYAIPSANNSSPLSPTPSDMRLCGQLDTSPSGDV